MIIYRRNGGGWQRFEGDIDDFEEKYHTDVCHESHNVKAADVEQITGIKPEGVLFFCGRTCNNNIIGPIEYYVAIENG